MTAASAGFKPLYVMSPLDGRQESIDEINAAPKIEKRAAAAMGRQLPFRGFRVRPTASEEGVRRP
jgi:hypothetical protein